MLCKTFPLTTERGVLCERNRACCNMSFRIMFGIWTLLFLAGDAVFASPAPDKVVFDKIPLTAEARSTASEVTSVTDNRKGRVFTFPEDSRSRPYEPQTGYYEQTYEVPQNRFDVVPPQTANGDNTRRQLLSLLPSVGGDGMQVGLDFKLPFFSIPYAKIFSGLTAPSAGGLFGSSLFGNSGGGLTNALGSGGLSSSLATMAAMVITAALLYPKVTGVFNLADGKGDFRSGNGVDDLFHNINSILGQFNIDGESCMKVALCSLSNARRERPHGRDSSSNTTPADIIDDLLNLAPVKASLAKGDLVQARDFGSSGGDCDFYNAENKCPVKAQAWHSLLSTLGSST